jgi:hypothetical protein
LRKKETKMKSKPPSILDPGFRYVKSGDTDLRKTFRRIRAQLRVTEAERPSVIYLPAPAQVKLK